MPRKNTIKALYLVGLMTICLTMGAVGQNFRFDELIGTYISGTHMEWTDARSLGDMDRKLELRSGLTYSVGNFCGRTAGDLIFSDDVLTINIGNTVKEGPCFYSIFTDKAVKEVDKNPPPPPKNTVLHPVRWSERIYLVEDSPDDEGWRWFLRAVNLGLIPHTERELFYFMGPFYSRIGDERKPVSGIPELPLKWRELILKKPINAKVIGIRRTDEKRCSITIDKGSRDGLYKDVTMLLAASAPTFFDTRVQSTNASTSILRAYSCETVRKGDIFTTRFTRPIN